MDTGVVDRLRQALHALADDPAARLLLQALESAGFVPPLPRDEYAVMEGWARQAEATRIHGVQ